MEDVKVTYDGTVRNEINTIIQFVYGTDGFDAKSVERQYISLILGNNTDFTNRFKWKRVDWDLLDEEVLKKNRTKKLNEEFKKLSVIKDYFIKLTIEDYIYIPINIYRVIEQSKKKFNITKSSKSNLNPLKIISNTNLLFDRMKILYDTNNLSNLMNEETLKIIKYNLLCHLASKKLILQDKINQDAFEWILKKIEEKFYKAVIHPGEMVGPISAQSIGERTTQLSVTGDTEVRIKEMNYYHEPRIDDLINRYMDRFGSFKTHITEDGKASHILPVKREWNILVPGLNYKTQKVEWKRVTEFSKHSCNGKLVRIKQNREKQLLQLYHIHLYPKIHKEKHIQSEEIN